MTGFLPVSLPGFSIAFYKFGCVKKTKAQLLGALLLYYYKKRMSVNYFLPANFSRESDIDLL